MSPDFTNAFPVLAYDEYPGAPSSVPWGLLDPHEHQARLNHSQSLKRLAERGGLAPDEMVAILTGRPWRDVRKIGKVEAVNELKRLLAEYEAVLAK